MIKAILVDDERPVRNLLRILLGAHCPDVEIVAECNDLPEAVKSINKLHPELVFLDIEMPGHSGLELLDFFEDDQIDFDIIFTTAYSQYAVQAFDLSAVGYLLKPIKPDKLKEAVERYRKLENKRFFKEYLEYNLREPVNKRIALATKYKTHFVNLTDILYVRGDGAYSEFCTLQGTKILMSKNLRHFEELLANCGFLIRISKTYIINKSHVTEVLKSGGLRVLLTGGVEVSVSSDKEHLLYT